METPMAGLFQVLWGQADGTFKKAVVLNGTDGEPLIIPTESENQITETICTRPFAVDWDGDGDLDLVVGNFSGSFYVFTGEGKGKFQPKPELIKSGDQPLKIPGVHSDPFVVDWDGDGDLDLVSGSSQGGIYWAENRAGKGKPPELTSFETLIPPGPRREYGQILHEEDVTGPVSATRVWVDDVNGDGKLDVLVGDNVRLLAPANGLTEDEVKTKQEEWQKDVNAALEELNAAKEDDEREKALQSYRELYQKRSDFIQEEMTGFVWLYVQK
jgi:hypothetical protein